jgi:hypothetical protein
MPDQIRRMDLARAVMASHTMKEDGLTTRVREQIGRQAHLFNRRLRTSHRDQDPIDAGCRHNLCLREIFAIVAIDGREREDRLDPLPGNDGL